MSDTTSKHDKDDETAVDSQGPADSDAEDGDDGDDDLDNALFGDDDDDIADAMDVDTAVAPEAVTSKEAGDEDLAEAGDVAPSGDHSAANQAEVTAKQTTDERNRVIMELMTEEQLERYEAFRRSAIDKAKVKRVLNTVAGHTVSEKMVLVMRGMAKVFVGELVEAARLIAHEQGDSGPLQPAHYQAAYQQLNHHGKIPHRTSSKRLKL